MLSHCTEMFLGSGLRRWLPAVAPCRARGSVQHCLGTRLGTTNMSTRTTTCRALLKSSEGDNGALHFDLKVTPQSQTAGSKGSKLRLDAFLAAALSEGQQASRAKVQEAIKGGLVLVNGKAVTKASSPLKVGDAVAVTLLPSPGLEALPEPIPLDVVYEDDHLMVINKPAGMAVHISPGHHTGTLVNALLHHCGLPGIRIEDRPASGSGGPGQAASRASAGDTSGSATLPDSASSLEVIARMQAGAVAGSAAGLAPTALQSQGKGSGKGQEASRGSSSSNDLLNGLVVVDEEEDLDEGEEEEELGLPASGPSGAGLADAGSMAAAKAAGARTGPGAAGTPVLLPAGSHPGVLRPGIVHRLDLGTSGLLVVAKREVAQRHLSAQFKARTVGRTYQSITLGCPSEAAGRVLTNIDRDSADRKRMAAYPYGAARGRTAASNYTVLERLAGGAAALVQWKLETGRTHQIRVHAKHIGHPLLGDVTYGGGGSTAANTMARGRPSWQAQLKQALGAFSRPALHARTLAFDHPVTGQRLSFEAPPPQDFQQLLSVLKELS